MKILIVVGLVIVKLRGKEGGAATQDALAVNLIHPWGGGMVPLSIFKGIKWWDVTVDGVGMVHVLGSELIRMEVKIKF